jgi:hypothetical protein
MVWKRLAALLCVIAAVPVFFLLVNHPAFLQKENEVVIRDNGSLRLGKPKPAGSEASQDLPFAWLSDAAYQALVRQQAGAPDPGNSGVAVALGGKGWTRWPAFPKGTDQDGFAKYNLRIEVWNNPSLNAVVVAFGGTNPKKLADWIANFRWFIPHHNDEYTQVVHTFQPLFAQEYEQLERRPDYAFLAHARLFATGHSLGGGLAQEFAYSVQNDKPDVPLVTKVYAFDPSPVTGYFSVDAGTRDFDKQCLSIDRIYQRREILAILRSFMNLLHRPSAQDPVVREIRYNLYKSWNPVYRHSITELGDHLVTVADPPQLNNIDVKAIAGCPVKVTKN